ncbi:MAG: DUF2244 domain-containing protein [Betaproteobacteria bacterium]|nr:MAG: DUF2244 domain-containing protein [Betaproteobacteria bacterium]TAG49415.1 MAG: DUF2244 domain-containing protein [Betaproteobacteria bacterium]
MSAIKIEWRRRFASDRRLRLAVFAALAALSGVFAVFLWWFFGAWVVVPFAGLEVGCVGVAFWWIERQAKDFDAIEVSESEVSVTRCRNQRVEQHSFARGWVQVDVETDGRGRERGIRLRQSGRSVSLAEFLCAAEQRAAARALRTAIST